MLVRIPRTNSKPHRRERLRRMLNSATAKAALATQDSYEPGPGKPAKTTVTLPKLRFMEGPGPGDD